MNCRIVWCRQCLTINLVTSFYLYTKKVNNKLIRKLHKKIYKVWLSFFYLPFILNLFFM